MHSYHHVSVPNALTVFEPLVDGSSVHIHGHVRHGHHKNFAVELLSGPYIVLHVNFRFHHEHIVAMNSNFNGSWGPEIRHRNPLHHSDHFDLKIKVHQTHYHIAVNGHHLADYPHRYPFNSVQAVGLKGDVHVDKVNFEGFHFRRQWGGDPAFGHGGYTAYGQPNYTPPVFIGGAQPFAAQPAFGGGVQPGFAPPQPGYAPPQPGYAPPQPGYGVPQPGIGGGIGFGAQPGYGAPPQPGYGQQYNPYG